MVVSPPSGTSIRKLADNTPRLRRKLTRVAAAQDPGVTIRTSA
jgi:hypothetical protein